MAATAEQLDSSATAGPAGPVESAVAAAMAATAEQPDSSATAATAV
ncbi:hypothetical protein LAUMK41_03496 [Mycobacterium attenuatum]|nr:hypothetical protein LAUMK41_03496 [Mycobacterium attenuatum]